MFNHLARPKQAFADWRRDGYPGVKSETDQYIDFLSETAPRTARFARFLIPQSEIHNPQFPSYFVLRP